MKRTRLSTVQRRKKLNRLTHAIYKLFREDKPWTVRLRRIKHEKKLMTEYGLSDTTIGFCFRPTRLLYVDYREDILPIFIHECLHAVFDEKTEDEIEELEQFMMENISNVQARRLLKVMTDNLEK